VTLAKLSPYARDAGQCRGYLRIRRPADANDILAVHWCALARGHADWHICEMCDSAFDERHVIGSQPAFPFAAKTGH